jgi:hypothetical protein
MSAHRTQRECDTRTVPQPFGHQPIDGRLSLDTLGRLRNLCAHFLQARDDRPQPLLQIFEFSVEVVRTHGHARSTRRARLMN